jgi:hypothetical protein
MRQTLLETAHLRLHLIASQQTLLLRHTLSKRLGVVVARAVVVLGAILLATLFIPLGLPIQLLSAQAGLGTNGLRAQTVTTHRYLVQQRQAVVAAAVTQRQAQLVMVKTAVPAAARVSTPAQQRLARVFLVRVMLVVSDMRHLRILVAAVAVQPKWAVPHQSHLTLLRGWV